MPIRMDFRKGDLTGCMRQDNQADVILTLHDVHASATIRREFLGAESVGIGGDLRIDIDRNSVFPLVTLYVLVIDLAELNGKILMGRRAQLIHMSNNQANPGIVRLNARYYIFPAFDMREDPLPDDEPFL